MSMNELIVLAITEPWNDSNLENGGNTPLSIPVLGRDSSLNFLSSRFFGDSDQST
jgi:hypothetical protein